MAYATTRVVQKDIDKIRSLASMRVLIVEAQKTATVVSGKFCSEFHVHEKVRRVRVTVDTSVGATPTLASHRLA